MRHTRTCLATALAMVLAMSAMTVSLSAQDLSGTWQMTVELDVGSGEPTFTFEQQGEELTGTYEGTFGSSDVIGRVTGEKVEFWFEVQGTKATYVGTISGDVMKGTCDYGGVGRGRWEGERVSAS